MIPVLANAVSSERSLPALMTAALFLGAHMAFLRCMSAEREHDRESEQEQVLISLLITQ